MQAQTVSINFGRGVDTKTDPKLVISTKLLTLENAVFTNSGRLSKRNGYDSMTLNIVGGGVLSSQTMVNDYRNELICSASNASGDQRLYSYSQTLNAWQDKGKYYSIAVEKDIIAQLDQNVTAGGVGGFTLSTSAVSGNIALFAYQNGNNSASYISVIDLSTGLNLLSNFQLPLTALSAKAVLLGASTLAVLYNAPTTGYLTLSIVSVTAGGGVSLGSPITLESSVSASVYDVVNTSTGAAIIYLNGTAIDVLTIDTTGATTHSAAIAAAGSLIKIVHVNSDSSGNVWVYWGSGAAGSIQLNYAVFSSTLSVVLATTTIGTASISELGTISSLSVSSTSQTVYYSTFSNLSMGSSDPISTTINQASVTTTAAGSPSVFFLNADIYSRPVSFLGRNHMAVIFASYLNSTGLLIDLADHTAVAKFTPDQSEYLFIVMNNGGAPGRRSGFSLNSLIPISSEKLYLGCCFISPGGLVTIANTSSNGLSNIPFGAVLGVASVTFDFAHIDSFQSLVQQDTLVLNGGIVEQYDSAQVSELGFTVNPEPWSFAPSGTGGVLGVGQWLYYFTYEWLDNLGNLHQSAPSNGYVVAFASGAANQVQFLVSTLQLTQKNNVLVVMWRTKNAGTIAYRVGAVNNSSSSGTVSITDSTLTDAQVGLNPTLYTQGGAILDNIAPPPAMVMWTNNNRIFVVDSENPKTLIEYSKTASQGTGISFSTGLLEIVVDSKYGSITGASPMDEKTVLLKENGVCYFTGDGASDAGSGSSISNIFFIPSDVGCENSKSVILYPNGIIFKSPKGIYLVSRGVHVSYFGMDVESFNSQNVISAIIMSGTTQIRFLTNSGSGKSLVYDYLYNQWGTFTNHEGVSSTVWNGLYVYVRSDGSIYKENVSSFLDASSPFAVLIQTSWIKANTIQNFQRIWEFGLLGDYSCASNDTTYGTQMSFAYDFVSSFNPSNVIYFSPSSGNTTTFQERIFPAQQKCDAIQIQIAELPTGASGEYIDFSDLDMEIAVKKGINKLSPFQSTG